MTYWMGWLAAAAALVVLEMFTGTFYLLMIAIGLAAGSCAALLGAPAGGQLAVAAMVGVLATLILRRSRYGRFARRDAERDPNVNLDIGQIVKVDAWQGGTPPVTRVSYRGAAWEAELESGVPEPGSFIIRAVRGSRLILGVGADIDTSDNHRKEI